MKIVMLAGNGGSGGLVGYIKGLISADVVPDDCEVTLFCGEKLSRKITNIASKIKIISTDYAVERGFEIVTNKPLPDELVNMVKNEKPDAVLFLNGYIRKGLECFPNLMVLHNQLHIDDYQLFRQGFSKLTLLLLMFRIAVRRSMKRANGVIFLSNFSKKQTDEKGVKYQKGTVVPFGFEDENRVLSIADKPFKEKIRLIYISALFPYKNHEALINTCVLLKNEGYEFELLLIGQKRKPVYRKLISIIKENGIEKNIIFTDWLEHSLIKEQIDSADIFVYASSTETTGYGLLEGMSRGALIAASTEAGFPDMLQDGGVYFNPYNANDIKNSIVSLIKMDADKRLQMRQRALDNSKKYSWENAARSHYDYIRGFIQK